jgi:hypothetical protein
MNDNTNNTINNSMLTTLDNPYNPFTQFDDWYAYDVEKGYYTCNYLARIAKTSDDLSEEDEALAIEQAIDEIVSMNIIGLYIKVNKDTFKDRSNP